MYFALCIRLWAFLFNWRYSLFKPKGWNYIGIPMCSVLLWFNLLQLHSVATVRTWRTCRRACAHAFACKCHVRICTRMHIRVHFNCKAIDSQAWSLSIATNQMQRIWVCIAITGFLWIRGYSLKVKALYIHSVPHLCANAKDRKIR